MWIHLTTTRQLLVSILVTQVLAWASQIFIGHRIFEKRAPALIDSWQESFIMAPFFIIAEVFFFIGWFPNVAKQVREQAKKDIAEWRGTKVI